MSGRRDSNPHLRTGYTPNQALKACVLPLHYVRNRGTGARSRTASEGLEAPVRHRKPVCYPYTTPANILKISTLNRFFIPILYID